MQPFSNNIIFFDTEFSTLDPYHGEILSIGLVKLDGQELYIELEYDGPYSDWVTENILPTLSGPKLSRPEAMQKVAEFIGGARPYMVANVNVYDAVYTYKMFGAESHPFYWIPLDFASMMFAHGMDPEDYIFRRNNFLEKLGIDYEKYHHHNALDDAKLLRETYLKLLEKEL
jgi:DNA polymerase III epsilon subunit-like protein